MKILTESPTVPRPNITTLDPLDISATFQAAPRPKEQINGTNEHVGD
jgi:hypothetical protein